MPSPEIIVIAAIAASNRLIGKNGKVPWHIPDDARRFQQLTMGHTVVMGRKTWENDVECCPLPHRRNIVVSRSLTHAEVSDQCPRPFELLFASSLQAAIAQAQDQTKVFMVGGTRIYAESLTLADTWELTLVDGDFEGDTFFPDYESLIGSVVELTHIDQHAGFRYETYRRLSSPSTPSPQLGT